MPTGRVKWFDTDKGFGFVTADDGEEVFLHSSALPRGAEVSSGTRLDFDIVDGRRGKQVLKARLVETPTRVPRRSTEEMAGLVEDVIKVLDGFGEGLRRGRYPEKSRGKQVAGLLRAIADDLEY